MNSSQSRSLSVAVDARLSSCHWCGIDYTGPSCYRLRLCAEDCPDLRRQARRARKFAANASDVSGVVPAFQACPLHHFHLLRIPYCPKIGSSLVART